MPAGPPIGDAAAIVGAAFIAVLLIGGGILIGATAWAVFLYPVINIVAGWIS